MNLSANNQPIRRIQLLLLNILVLLMPFHYLLFAVLLESISVLKLWRDALMLLIFALELAKDVGYRLDSSFGTDAFFMGLSVLYVVMAPNLFPALNVVRVYILPIMLFHVMKNLALTPDEINSLLRKLMAATAVCCVYGIVQAYLLGPDFLIKLGYKTENGVLSASYFLSNFSGVVVGRNVQRVVSTFASANICAFFLSTVFILMLNLRKFLKISNTLYYSFMFLVMGTVVLTFSRSCWLAIAVAMLVNWKRVWRFIVKGWKPIVGIACIIIAILIGYGPLREALMHVIKSSLSGSDTSVLSHFSTINTAIEIIKEAPYGLGLGTNGPRALNYGTANLVESSYLLMMFEYGILGGLLYFYDYVFVAFYALRNRRKAPQLSSLIFSLVLFALVAFFNIPYIQEIECTSLMLICLGLAYAAIEQKRKQKVS